jgi:hypothetical protein
MLARVRVLDQRVFGKKLMGSSGGGLRNHSFTIRIPFSSFEYEAKLPCFAERRPENTMARNLGVLDLKKT